MSEEDPKSKKFIKTEFEELFTHIDKYNLKDIRFIHHYDSNTIKEVKLILDVV